MEHPELKAAKNGTTGNISMEKRIALPNSQNKAKPFRRKDKITPTSTAVGVIPAL
jgi:hypothetical protein